MARAGLGTINHTFLTIEHARKCGVAIIDVIPYDERISAGDAGNIFALVEKNADIEEIVSVLRRRVAVKKIWEISPPFFYF